MSAKLLGILKSFPGNLHILLLLVLIALTRMPFLDAGYGEHADAWRVAKVARSIAETGNYEVSRFPGYPVHEYVCSWFWQTGPIGLNSLSTLLGLLACYAVWKVTRYSKMDNGLLLVCALAATPVFYISSVTSKDYIWALALSWMAILMALNNRALLCGLFLGLAVGCRITSGAMALPLLLILLGGNRGSSRYKLAGVMLGIAFLTAALCFLPVWLRYHWDFFTFYKNHSRPDAMTILRRGTLEVWGSLGLFGIIISLASGFVRKCKSAAKPANPMLIPALAAIVVIYGCAYLRLPDQAGYLLPIVPAILIIINWLVPPVLFRICCLLLIVSPFIELTPKGFIRGAIVGDHSRRLSAMEDVMRFVKFTEAKFPGRNLVVVGGWEPIISVAAPPNTVKNRYVYLATEKDLEETRQAGWKIAYAGPAIREFNYRVNKVDLLALGAIDLRNLANARQ